MAKPRIRRVRSGALPSRGSVGLPRGETDGNGFGDQILEKRSRIRKVSWSLGYIGLLGYTLAVITYALPIGEASIIIAIIGILLAPDRIRVPRFLVIFGLFLGWGALGITSAIDPGVTGIAIMDALKLWAIAFVAVNVIRTPPHLRVYIVFFIALFAMYPARGAIFNYVLGYDTFGRAIWNHIYSNPNDLAALCFLPLSIAFGLLATERKGLFRWGAIASVVVLPVLMFLTQSRGTFLALVILALVVLSIQRKKMRSLVVIGLVAIAAISVVPGSAWKRFAGLTALSSVETVAQADEEGSADQRFKIWRTALIVIQSNPVRGVGLGGYGLAQERYAYRVPGAPIERRDAHSTYLRVAAETGLPGLAIFFGILVTAFTRSRSVRRKADLWAPRQAKLLFFLEMGLAGYLLAGVFGSYGMLAFFYLHIAILFAAAEVVEAQLRAANRQKAGTRSPSRRAIAPLRVAPGMRAVSPRPPLPMTEPRT